MKLAVTILVLAAGCDRLFDIHRIEVPAGSGPDAPIVDLDATTDAANCGMHDEDGDGMFDRCDPCPTISDAGDGDEDHDGVGDACDPDPSLPNTIDGFYSFQNGLGLTGMTDTYPNDTLRIGNGGNVVTTKAFTAPEVIDATVASLPPGASFEIVVNPGSTNALTCEISTTCTSSPTCLFLSTSTQSHELAMTLQPAEVGSLVMYRALAVVSCSVNDRAAQHTIDLPGVAMPDGKLELQAIGGPATLAHMIVYNLE